MASHAMEDLEDRRRQQTRERIRGYGRHLTAQHRDERQQDNSDRRQLASQHLSDSLLHSCPSLPSNSSVHSGLSYLPNGCLWGVHWTSNGRPLDIPPSMTRLVPLSCPVHLSNGYPWDVHWTSNPH